MSQGRLLALLVRPHKKSETATAVLCVDAQNLDQQHASEKAPGSSGPRSIRLAKAGNAVYFAVVTVVQQEVSAPSLASRLNEVPVCRVLESEIMYHCVSGREGGVGYGYSLLPNPRRNFSFSFFSGGEGVSHVARVGSFERICECGMGLLPSSLFYKLLMQLSCRKH